MTGLQDCHEWWGRSYWQFAKGPCGYTNKATEYKVQTFAMMYRLTPTVILHLNAMLFSSSIDG